MVRRGLEAHAPHHRRRASHDVLGIRHVTKEVNVSFGRRHLPHCARESQQKGEACVSGKKEKHASVAVKTVGRPSPAAEARGGACTCRPLFQAAPSRPRVCPGGPCERDRVCSVREEARGGARVRACSLAHRHDRAHVDAPLGRIARMQLELVEHACEGRGRSGGMAMQGRAEGRVEGRGRPCGKSSGRAC